MLMGATLPAVARWVRTTPDGVSWLGFFYGGNTCGAVIGSLLAGFYLLRVHDTAFATFVAVGLNMAVAAVALLLARVTPYDDVDAGAGARPTVRASGAWAVYATIALSGMTALSAEVIWTRMLSLLFGATVYTFSLILAVFLLGIGIGSSIGSAMARGMARPRLGLGWCQMLLCGAIAWAAYMCTQSLPWWPINPSFDSNPWFNFQLDLVRAMWAVLPAAILWGASFPLALASVASDGQDPARLVSGIYAANTVGAIVGALTSSLILVSWLGSQRSEQILIIVSGLSALLVLEAAPTTQDGRPRSQFAGTIPIVAAAVCAALLARNVPPIPPLLIAYGRYAATRIGQAEIIYWGEGMECLGCRVAAPGRRAELSQRREGPGVERASGHAAPADARPHDDAHPHQPEARARHRMRRRRDGGRGVDRSESGAAHDRGDRAARAPRGLHLLRRTQLQRRQEPQDARAPRRRAELSADDGREVRRDYVGSARPVGEGRRDALHAGVLRARKASPESGGCRHAVRAVVREQPGSGEERNRHLHGSVSERRRLGQHAGRAQATTSCCSVSSPPKPINVDEIEQRLQRPEYAQVRLSLSQIGMNSAVDLFSTYAGTATELQPWLKDASINRDRNLRLQYLAGLGLNLYQSESIYADMLAYASGYPNNLFLASDATTTALKAGIRREQGR